MASGISVKECEVLVVLCFQCVGFQSTLMLTFVIGSTKEMYLVTKRQQSYIRTLFSIPFHCLNIYLGKFSTEICFGKKHTPPSVNLNGFVIWETGLTTSALVRLGN
jgi:hypothetical protein